MRSVLLNLFLWCSLYGVQARVADPICDTLVLGNGRELIILLESVSNTHVFYKRCPDDTTNRLLSMPLTYVKGLRVNGEVRPLFAQPAEISVTVDSSSEAIHSPTWIFWNKKKNFKKRITEGDVLKVRFVEDGRQIVARGYFRSLDPQVIVLQEGGKPERRIPRVAVTRITPVKRGSTAGAVLGGAAILAGAGIIVGIFLLIALVAVFVAILGGGQGDNSLKGESNAGCLIGGLLILAGLGAVIASLPSGMDHPFSKDWEVYQEGVITSPEPGRMMP